MDLDLEVRQPKQKEHVQGNASIAAQKVKIEREFIVACQENFGLDVG